MTDNLAKPEILTPPEHQQIALYLRGSDLGRCSKVEKCRRAADISKLQWISDQIVRFWSNYFTLFFTFFFVRKKG